jgi:hypothetical protein
LQTSDFWNLDWYADWEQITPDFELFRPSQKVWIESRWLFLKNIKPAAHLTLSYSPSLKPSGQAAKETPNIVQAA